MPNSSAHRAKHHELRRVVITGAGLVTPLGTGLSENWEALISAKSGVGPITRFDASRHSSRIAAEVKGFDPLRFIEKREIRRMDPFIQYAIGASQMAVEDAGIPLDVMSGPRTGVYIGSGIGGIGTIEEYHKILLEKGPDRVSPFFLIATISNEASGQVSIRFKAGGPNSASVTACASGAHAVGDAFRIIQRGDADRMIAGGAEAPITPLGVAGFCAMKALSERNDDPARASRPFDKTRDGFVVGEGAGILIMEELGAALRRGARIYAEIVGYGMTGDAFHPAAPAEDGGGAVRAMQAALDDAGIPPEDVQYINAHGTSTPLNDKIETAAIKSVFGDQARKLAVSSSKSMTGHGLGAAGGIEAAITALSISRQMLTPTANYEVPDPDCDLDYVPNSARAAEIVCALSNSFGFGGTNASLLFRRFDG
ncbi:MAG: beta-ketoacyl-ACP synthase II [Candidatus Aminicenantes bacterium]|nr:beta-ketoacyl-ACP synthase II [Candidatus Aminicenantes bacterium]